MVVVIVVVVDVIVVVVVDTVDVVVHNLHKAGHIFRIDVPSTKWLHK